MSDDVRPDPNQPELDGPENDSAAAEEATAAAESDTFERATRLRTIDRRCRR